MLSQWLGILTCVAALAALGISVFGLLFKSGRLSGRDEERIDALETDVREVKTAMAQVAAVEKDVAVMRAELTGFDRLTTSKLDELTRSMARLENRSFDPPTPSPRRPRAEG